MIKHRISIRKLQKKFFEKFVVVWFCEKTAEYVNREALLMPYHSLGYSHLRLGITVWATATKSLLHKIEVGQNNILRTITPSEKSCHTTKLFKTLGILKLKGIYKLELGKLMHKFVNQKIPLNLIEDFTAIKEVHSHCTRQTKNSKFFSHWSQRHLLKTNWHFEAQNFGPK